MTVYVDNASVMFKGKPRYHLTADTLDELHAFTLSLAIHRCWFHRHPHHPHYDITEPQRSAALTAGALAVTSRDLLIKARFLAAELKPSRLKNIPSCENPPSSS
jgi:hypothetical protein